MPVVRRKALNVAAVFAATVALAGLAPRTARADDPSFRLSYDTAVEGCPTAPRIHDLVVARLGFDPFEAPSPTPAAPAKSVLRIAIARDEGHEGELIAFVAREPGGTRVLHERGGDCAELAASVALAASILVDPTGSLAKQYEARTQPAPSAGATKADDPFATTEKRAEEPPPAPPPRPKARVFAGARTLGSVGLSPSPAIGFSVEGGVRIERLILRLEGRADLPVSADRLADGSGARTSILLGSIVPCYAVGIFHFCGVLAAGGFLVESEDITPATRNQAFFVAAGLRPSLEVPLAGPLRFVASAEALVPLRRLTLSVRNIEVWTASPVTASVGAGLLVQFM